MGPAPMIRMVEMSVRLGIKSHGMELGTKKGRAGRASPRPLREGTPRARVVFRPVSAPAKPPKTGHQRGNSAIFGSARCPGEAGVVPLLNCTERAYCYRRQVRGT